MNTLTHKIMKHALLILAHNNLEILNRIIDLYDSEEIDFYIHIDIKSNLDLNTIGKTCKYSKVYFVERMDVQWAHHSLTFAELNILKEASKKAYDYYHMISGVDFPIITKKEFLAFFEKHKGSEFVEFAPVHLYEENKIIDRVNYHHVLLKNKRT